MGSPESFWTFLDHFSNAIIASGVVFSAWQSWRNSKAIGEVHLATNSMHDEIVTLARADATQEERARAKGAATLSGEAADQAAKNT
jgi:uncharacterized membrane protein YccC